MAILPPPRQLLSKLDMYRKVPTDLMEGTKRGTVLSWVSLLTIITLFVMETLDFINSTKLIADLSLDRSDDVRLRINFNITMLDLSCEYAVLDVVSAMGTDQNVTAHVTKYQLDGQGVKKIYRNQRNRNQRDIQLDLYDETVVGTIEELHENGEDAIPLNEETLEYALRENEYVFVDYYASWCNHCRDLATTWEALAELMMDVGEHLGRQHLLQKQKEQQQQQQQQQKIHNGVLDITNAEYVAAEQLVQNNTPPVMIAKVDCVLHPNLCNVQEGIRAYPTLRLYVDGQRWYGGDYKGHRTILEMIEWLFHIEEEHKSHIRNEKDRQLHLAHQAARQRLASTSEDGDMIIESDEERKWHDKIIRDKKRLHYSWKEEEHPGCQLSGHLLVDRTPGNFHIQARSSNQEFAPHMTNVSHMVHSLTVGDPMVSYWLEDSKEIYNNKRNQNVVKKSKKMQQLSKLVPQTTTILDKINPMDGNVYINYDLHESYHHYLKLVSTRIEGLESGNRQLRVYQIMENSQLSFYNDDIIINDDNNDNDMMMNMMDGGTMDTTTTTTTTPSPKKIINMAEAIVPEARFAYDLSPIAVSYRKYSRPWYDYCTSIMAIIGGVFTVFGMIEATIQATMTSLHQKQQERQNQQQQQQQQQNHHHQQFYNGDHHQQQQSHLQHRHLQL